MAGSCFVNTSTIGSQWLRMISYRSLEMPDMSQLDRTQVQSLAAASQTSPAPVRFEAQACPTSQKLPSRHRRRVSAWRPVSLVLSPKPHPEGVDGQLLLVILMQC